MINVVKGVHNKNFSHIDKLFLLWIIIPIIKARIMNIVL